MIDFGKYAYHPVIHLPPDYEIYDFSGGYDPDRERTSAYGVGKYDERRKGMYVTEIFGGIRDVHVGIDIAAPPDTPVHAFFEGEYFLLGNNSQPGDYGYTLITLHRFGGKPLYVLHGHLSAKSLEGKSPGGKFAKGDVIAWVGDRSENGGWNPHLHFQLSYERPEKCDMPGVVSLADRERALRIYPDPRLVLGKLY